MILEVGPALSALLTNPGKSLVTSVKVVGVILLRGDLDKAINSCFSYEISGLTKTMVIESESVDLVDPPEIFLLRAPNVFSFNSGESMMASSRGQILKNSWSTILAVLTKSTETPETFSSSLPTLTTHSKLD